MAGQGAVAARERARLAKVTRYADRAAREAKIEDTVTEFYLAADAYEAALAAMTTARAAMAAQVGALLTDLKEPVSGVAVLCDLTAAQVRALRKQATAVDQTAVGPETDPVETSTPAKPEPGRSDDENRDDVARDADISATPDEPEPDGDDDRNGDSDKRDGDETGAGSEQKRAS